LGARKAIRIQPKRYELVRLRGDPSDRNHHAIIFSNVLPCEKLTPKSILPALATWTPTGHGWVSKWNVIDHDKVEEILKANSNPEKHDEKQTKELALLIPRSLWIWLIPNWIMPLQSKMRLFYLEAQVSLEADAVPSQRLNRR